jgi:hypothetical protein
MSQVIRCEKCNHALQVPDSLAGQLVRCPSCQHTFEAPATGAEAPPPARREALSSEPAEPDRYREPHRVRRERRESYRDDYDDFRRRDYAPHRGAVILTLGILGLVICGPLAIVAWVMGSNDMASIRRREMDPSGEGLTRAGQILGIIGTIFFILNLCFVGAWLTMFAGAVRRF